MKENWERCQVGKVRIDTLFDRPSIVRQIESILTGDWTSSHRSQTNFIRIFSLQALHARHISQSSSKSTRLRMSTTYRAVLHSMEPMRTATSCTEDRYCSTLLPASTNNESHRLSSDVCSRNDVNLRDELDRIVASNYATIENSRSLPRSEVRSSSPDWREQHNLQLFGQLDNQQTRINLHQNMSR